MKRKIVQLLIGASVTAAVAGAQVPAALAEEAQPETAVEIVVETEAAEAETEAAEEAETETETETEEDDFIEGSALLSECGYEAGEIDEDGWESRFLNMKFTPAKGITMGIDENEQMSEYYLRHGEDRVVANSEMVAKDSDGGYVQMTVEVNPNGESAEDILERFAEIEELELVSKAKDTEIAGKNFRTCTGIFEKEKYMIGACTDQDDIVIAVKIKYQDTDARKAMLKCFEAIETEEETEEETGEAEEMTESVELEQTGSLAGNAKRDSQGGINLLTPEEFEEEELISEAPETEAETE